MLVLPELDLVELVGLGLATVQKVVKAAAAATVSAPTTGAAMLQEAIADHASRFLATRIPPVDAALRGGLCAGTITEVTGPSGCGKTQFCTMVNSFNVAYRTLALYKDVLVFGVGKESLAHAHAHAQSHTHARTHAHDLVDFAPLLRTHGFYLTSTQKQNLPFFLSLSPSHVIRWQH